MNKTDLVNEIAAKAGLTKEDSKKALNAVLESIGQALANEDKVQLIGFGTFAVVEKPSREGINPRTKEKIQIPARKVVKFKPADTLGK
ncbi:MAG: HU family DNA-binding protein [Muribaculaceae bacterium]|nr:HU family DNA-binding protein [Muribaculaceae bacterium]